MHQNILAYHALTGCDIVSEMSGHGKKVHRKYLSNMQHYYLDSDTVYFPPLQWEMQNNFYARYIHRPLMKLQPMRYDIVCFKRERNSKRSHHLPNVVWKSTSSVHTIRTMCGFRLMLLSQNRNLQLEMTGMRIPWVADFTQSWWWVLLFPKTLQILCTANVKNV